MAHKNSLMEQVRRNLVALISLSVAVTGLAYNTWRNEASEHNRNQRLVSIQILVMLGEMQQVVLDGGHEQDDVEAERARRKGWAIALTLRDISMVAEGGVPDSAERLLEIWNEESKVLGAKNASGKAAAAQTAIEAAIDKVRQDTHAVLRSLN